MRSARAETGTTSGKTAYEFLKSVHAALWILNLFVTCANTLPGVLLFTPHYLPEIKLIR